jgi:hypothetical protein
MIDINLQIHFDNAITPSQCWLYQPTFLCHRSLHNLLESGSIYESQSIIIWWNHRRANALKECFKDFYRSNWSSFPLPLPFLCLSFFALRQYPNKGHSTLWQMRSFFHVNFWCFLRIFCKNLAFKVSSLLYLSRIRIVGIRIKLVTNRLLCSHFCH